MKDNTLVQINDSRVSFKGVTFSNYKKSQVIKKLNQAMYYQKIEEAFFWTCELICTNLFLEIWNIYFIFMGKYVHKDNPKLPLYMIKKFNDFKNIAASTGNDLELKNKKEIRLLFCSLTLILCSSDKNTILDDLNYKFNFNSENIYENLKAPHMKYIEYIYLQHDPKEFFIPFNELIYHLKETKNKIDINYWINWVIHYDALCNSKKNHVLCQQRDIFVCKNDKQSKNIIWILWDIILKLHEDESSDIIKSISKSVFDLFCVRYSVSFNKKRKHLIYYAIELYLNKSINPNIPIIKNKSLFEHLDHNVNIIFEKLKKYEVPFVIPDDDDNLKPKTNKEKKMDMYENMYNNL